MLLAVVVAVGAAAWFARERFGGSTGATGTALGSPEPPFDESTFVTAVAFSGNGQVLGVGTASGLVTLWRVADGQPIASLRPRVTRIDSLAIDEDASRVAMGFKLGIVALWDQRRRMETGILSLVPAQPADPPGNPVALSFQPGGQVLLCFDADYNLLRFLELSSGSQYQPIGFAPRSVASAALSHLDQRFLALGDSRSGNVEVFDLLVRQSLGTVSGGGEAVHAVAISPDGGRVATAEAHSLFYLWDVATRTQLSMFDGPPPVTSLAFTSDGRLLASGGQGAVAIWDATTFRESRRLDLKAAPKAF